MEAGRAAIHTDRRGGDLCANICEQAIALTGPVDQKIGDRLTAMGAQVRLMLDAALQVFVAGDVKAAQGVIDGDEVIDRANVDGRRTAIAASTEGRS